MGLPKESLWATCFRDEKGMIPQDDEAADACMVSLVSIPTHVLFFGRKDNFWKWPKQALAGHVAKSTSIVAWAYCDLQGTPGHTCQVNGDCKRFLELWNLVFNSI